MPTDAEIWEWIIEKVEASVEILGPHAMKILFGALTILILISHFAVKQSGL
jgi:hypothetical protein